jgi:hypothetical protein
MALNIEALLNNNNGTATLILPPTSQVGRSGNPRVIIGIIQNANFTIAGQNTFASPEPEKLKGITSGFNGVALPNLLGGSITGGNVVNKQIVSGLSTIKSWQSSADFKFTLEIMFIAISSQRKGDGDKISGTDDVTLPCIELLSLVYPSGVDNIDSKNVFYSYQAPVSYSFKGFYDPKKKEAEQPVTGVTQIAIGNWLRLRNMLCDSMTVTFSREIQKNGTPLTASVSMEFSCFHQYRYSDIVDLFTNPLGVDNIEELSQLSLQQSGRDVAGRGLAEDALKTLINTAANLAQGAGTFFGDIAGSISKQLG